MARGDGRRRRGRNKTRGKMTGRSSGIFFQNNFVVEKNRAKRVSKCKSTVRMVSVEKKERIRNIS